MKINKKHIIVCICLMLTVCSVAKATINPIYRGETVRRISMGSKPPVYLKSSQNQQSSSSYYDCDSNYSIYRNERYFAYSSKDSSVEYRWASGSYYSSVPDGLNFYNFKMFFIYDSKSILQEKKIYGMSYLFSTDRYDYLVYNYGDLTFWKLPSPMYISGVLLIDQNNPRRFDALEFKYQEILLTEQIGDNFRIITVEVEARYNFVGRFFNKLSSHIPIGRYKQQDKFYEYIYDLESKKTSRRKITKKEAKVLIYRKEK